MKLVDLNLGSIPQKKQQLLNHHQIVCQKKLKPCFCMKEMIKVKQLIKVKDYKRNFLNPLKVNFLTLHRMTLQKLNQLPKFSKNSILLSRSMKMD